MVPECEGEFDTPPTLVRYAFAAIPTAVGSPRRWNDLKISRHPLTWEGTTRFDVDSRGVPRNVRSDATRPKEFAQSANAAVKLWRFQPATRNGQAVEAACEVAYSFDLRMYR